MSFPPLLAPCQVARPLPGRTLRRRPASGQFPRDSSVITTEPCSPEPWNHGFHKEIIPKWPQDFRLVKYYNLPR